MFEEYDTKKIGIIAGVLVLALVVLFFVLFGGNTSNENKVVLNNDIGVQFEDNRFVIPVEKITNDDAYVDSIGDIQFEKDGDTSVLTLSGMYKGHWFSKSYFDEIKPGEYKYYMGIGHNMIPYDGIIQGYIAESFENDTAYAYIYLDEDWRKQVGETHIIWGKDKQFIKKFAWKKVGKGIYMNKIEDDIERFSKDNPDIRVSGIYVGDFKSLDEITRNDINWTAIRTD